MDSYALYNYEYCPAEAVQSELFVSQNVKVDMSTEDKNLWLDRLFGDRNSDVRVQRLRKRGEGADKFPCKVLAHGNGRVVWLRLENEKIKRLWLKQPSATPYEPETISKEPVPVNPFSHVFLDFREGRNLIAIMKENEAWRNTDMAAQILAESLNLLMQASGYGFGIIIKPATVKKDFVEYNRELVLKKNKRVKKLTIYFGSGTIDPHVTDFISRSPLLKRLMKEMYRAKRGRLELDDPFGPSILDRRKHDFILIAQLIGSNLTNDDFGLSVAYEDGQEVVCGKDVKLFYPMREDTFDMLLSKDLFGEYNINRWLDKATDYITQEKDETAAENKRKKQTAKHVQDTSSSLDLL